MPPIADPNRIRALLDTDRPWSVYALGDLCAALFPQTTWFHAPGPALALLYHGFHTPVLFTLGEPTALRAVLAEVAGTTEMYLHVRPEVVPLLEETYRVSGRKEMARMILDPAAFRAGQSEEVTCLGSGDLERLRRLYAGGEAAGEAPDFFTPSMLAEGVYFGVREGDELAAAAGTHLVAEAEGVAAIGNVYTRQDRRGRGLASRLVAAVAAELLNCGARTIALNVARDNAPARRVYEKLGFAHYCDFVEGLAVKAMTGGTS
jgi:GNAT superfamily N-acetyltransferase